MPIFKRPGVSPPSSGVRPHAAFRMIEEFRRWLGHQTIEEKRAKQYKGMEVTNVISRILLRERQPILDALSLYENATFGRRRVPRSLPDELTDLASVAAMYTVIGQTLGDDVARHHRHGLLGPSFRPTLLEWKAASSIVRTNNTALYWLPPKGSGPEFIAKLGDQELEVECKYVSHMIGELLGDDQAGLLADQIVAGLRAREICGEIQIEVLPDADGFPQARRSNELKELISGVGVGESAGEIDGFCRIRSVLAPAGTMEMKSDEWQRQMALKKDPQERVYGNARARPPMAIDPIAVFMRAPHRNGEQLLHHLWERKFKKAAEQCTGRRAALIVLEWEGVQDPSTFSTSDGIQALLERTFSEYKHVAAIALRCDSVPTRIGGIVDYSSRAYLARSHVTEHRKVAELIRLDQPN